MILDSSSRLVASKCKLSGQKIHDSNHVIGFHLPFSARTLSAQTGVLHYSSGQCGSYILCHVVAPFWPLANLQAQPINPIAGLKKTIEAATAFPCPVTNRPLWWPTHRVIVVLACILYLLLLAGTAMTLWNEKQLILGLQVREEAEALTCFTTDHHYQQ